MSKVVDVLEDTFEKDYYDAEKDFQGQIPEGDWFAHVVSLNVKMDMEIKRSKSIADIYEVYIAIADEASKVDYNGVSGSAFVGREFKSRGIFKFKKPPTHLKSQGFTPNPGGNGGYRDFCDAMGIKLAIAEERDNGKHLYEIPNLTIDDIYGCPVIATLQKRFWKNKDGSPIISEKTDKPMHSMECTDLQRWEEGERKEDETDVVPF
ncbi:MAG: hypothetical protein H8D23_20925 [Candidatus Brocadiales bacterium]|nr:hypothetical protein [Candidatus Brocadiales bacterium]